MLFTNFILPSLKVLSERLAVMLNFNVKQLTGAKCKNLKVSAFDVSHEILPVVHSFIFLIFIFNFYLYFSL